MRRNIYNLDEDDTLVITTSESKSLKDLKRIIASGKPQTVVDKFIGLYIPTLEPSQITMDLWAQVTEELQDLDPEEPYVLEDPEVPDVYLDREYDLKASELEGLVTENPWILTVEIPEPTITVESFKLDNSSLFTSYSKAQGVELSGKVISITESNQNGIAAVLTGLNLAEELGLTFEPFNFKAETITGTTSITFDSLTDFKVFALTFMAERRKFF
jgi:hypothetical protein